jgi:hypothetical protein
MKAKKEFLFNVNGDDTVIVDIALQGAGWVRLDLEANDAIYLGEVIQQWGKDILETLDDGEDGE